MRLWWCWAPFGDDGEDDVSTDWSSCCTSKVRMDLQFHNNGPLTDTGLSSGYTTFSFLVRGRDMSM